MAGFVHGSGALRYTRDTYSWRSDCSTCKSSGGSSATSRGSSNGARAAAMPLSSRSPLQTELERLRYATSTGGSGGNWRLTGGGFGNHGGGYGGDGRWQPEEWDWSWRIAPGVHVFLRGRVEDARMAVLGVVENMKEVVSNVSGDPKVPVVILLSWMGASQKNLDKYRAYYEGLNYEVHMVFNGLRTAFFPSASREQAKKLERLIAAQPEERPVFVHAFSIGTGVYGMLIDQLKDDMKKLDRMRNQIAGVIFDSGPAPIFPHDVAKGLHTVCPAVSKAVWEMTAKAMFFVTQARRGFEQAEHALRGMQFNSPQLYFYSLDDKVIPNIHHAIADFVDKNKQRGFEVYQKWWNESVHASHFKLHQEEYLQSLQTFLDRCLELRMINDSNKEKLKAHASTQ